MRAFFCLNEQLRESASVSILIATNHIAAQRAQSATDQGAFHGSSTLMADDATCGSATHSAHSGAGAGIRAVRAGDREESKATEGQIR